MVVDCDPIGHGTAIANQCIRLPLNLPESRSAKEPFVRHQPFFLLLPLVAVAALLAASAPSVRAQSDANPSPSMQTQLDQARKALAEQAALLAQMRAEMARQAALLDQLERQQAGKLSGSDQDAASLQTAVQGLRAQSTAGQASAQPASVAQARVSTAPGAVPGIPSGVAPAISPVRFLTIGMTRPVSSNLTVKAGSIQLTPIGALKATAIEDSSSPNGDDFPLPGFITDTGPNGAPEFHLKARSSRIGVAFAWNDPDPKLSLTGKLEIDFEGNFNRSDNRNLSSIRSNNPSLREAWMRMDYAATKNNIVTALFGQDWSPFGSTTVPTMLETTGYGIGFGVLYERTPQMRLGVTHKFGGFSLMPEIAITDPAAGMTPGASFLSQQLGYGERQGADSNHPDLEARLVGQWQLDPAPGVAPAEIVFSGEHGRRTAIVLASAVPAAYSKTFAQGATVGSHTDGWDAEWQLPTRWATLTGKFYSGADLRFFFASQLYSYFTDTTGLADLASASSMDGSSTVYFGTNGSGQQVVAPERPIRTDGGYAQLGLPLSRWFHANPAGRNGGWAIYGMYGVDQAKTRDLDRLGEASRRYSTMAVGTLSYALNRKVSFTLEQSLYTTHANQEMPLPTFKGGPAREWNDVREEFGPTFSF